MAVFELADGPLSQDPPSSKDPGKRQGVFYMSSREVYFFTLLQIQFLQPFAYEAFLSSLALKQTPNKRKNNAGTSKEDAGLT